MGLTTVRIQDVEHETNRPLPAINGHSSHSNAIAAYIHQAVPYCRVAKRINEKPAVNDGPTADWWYWQSISSIAATMVPEGTSRHSVTAADANLSPPAI